MLLFCAPWKLWNTGNGANRAKSVKIIGDKLQAVPQGVPFMGVQVLR